MADLPLLGDDPESPMFDDVWNPLYFLRLIRYHHPTDDPFARCPFAVAIGHFALAARVKDDKGELTTDAEYLLIEGQKELLSWASVSSTPLYDMLTSEWPIWEVLEVVASKGGKSALPMRRDMDKARLGATIFACISDDSIISALRAFCVAERWVLVVAPTMTDCVYLQLATSALETIARMPVVVVSNVWGWDADVEMSLLRAVRLMAEYDELEVIGFPLLSRGKEWRWNVKQIVLEWWKLEYRTFPTGYASTIADECFAGDASSTTRVYRSFALWHSLMEAVGLEEVDGSSSAYNWVVELDVEIRRRKTALHTCMTHPIYEDNYLARATLSSRLAETLRIERASFGADVSGNVVQTRCPGVVEAWPDALLKNRGTVLPYCLRKYFTMAAQMIADTLWDTSDESDAVNFAVADTLAGALFDRRATIPPRETDDIYARLSVFVSTNALPRPLRFLDPLSVHHVSSAEWYIKVDNATVMVVHFVPSLDAADYPLRTTLLGNVEVRARIPGAGTCAATNSSGSNSTAVTSEQEPASDLPKARVVADIVACGGNVSSFVFDDFVMHHENVVVHFMRNVTTCGNADVRDDVPVIMLGGELVWDAYVAEAIRHAVALLQRRTDLEIIGFPVLRAIGGRRHWRWTGARIRHQFWKLTYGAEHDGALTDADNCRRTDAASATRVFRSGAIWRALMSEISFVDAYPHNWLVELDVVTKHSIFALHICATPPLTEAVDYREEAVLSQSFALKYAVEVADFNPNGVATRQVHCLDGDWYQVLQRGLVSPWCFRQRVMKAFREVVTWWTHLDTGEDHSGTTMVIPEEGTFIALWRNPLGIFPWDSDFDIKLYASNGMSIDTFLEHLRAPNFTQFGLQAHHYTGCGQDAYILLGHKDIRHHIGDAYFNGNRSRARFAPWNTMLFGVNVSMGPYHLNHIYFRRYGKPAKKVFGDGQLLQCMESTHTACLPDCSQGGPCEFEDHFFHVDFFADEHDWDYMPE
eukprot:GEMP01003931.1.p1 GENE.GEMP01003931.1~~GEMP01003931.1.p1  ORF type:complete len:987 (-),score=264.27 GEMP01003931.1:569-3529(-)